MILIVEEQGLINIVGEIYYYNILPSKLVVFLMEISRILAWKKKVIISDRQRRVAIID